MRAKTYKELKQACLSADAADLKREDSRSIGEICATFVRYDDELIAREEKCAIVNQLVKSLASHDHFCPDCEEWWDCDNGDDCWIASTAPCGCNLYNTDGAENGNQ